MLALASASDRGRLRPRSLLLRGVKQSRRLRAVRAVALGTVARVAGLPHYYEPPDHRNRRETVSYNLVEAGAAVGKSKSSILRAIRKGLISAARDEATGGWLIEPAELHRVYPPVAPGSVQATNGTSRNHDETAELRVRLEAAEAAIRFRDEVIADLRQQRDREAEERRRLTALLADQRPATSPAAPAESNSRAAPRRSWWLWRREPA